MSKERPRGSSEPSKRREKPVVGWREWVALPDLGIPGIKVKVDTGARSSALHAYDCRPYQRAGRRWLLFKVHPVQRDSKHEVLCRAEVIGERFVRSSSGQRQLRWIVRTTLQMGQDDSYPIELSLTSRDAMGFRMLLGREAIRGRFLVDAGRSYRLPGTEERKAEARRVGKAAGPTRPRGEPRSPHRAPHKAPRTEPERRHS